MQKLAQQLKEASQQLKQGNGQQAADNLQQAANDLSQMQKESDQLPTLDQTIEDIQLAKDAMNCKSCGGQGCEHCQGQKPGQGEGQEGKAGQGQGKGQMAQQPGQKGKGQQQLTGQPGKGIGRGHIDSESDGQEKHAGYFDTKVKQQVGKGSAVIIGEADGPNAKGRVHDAIKAEFQSKDTGPADPLTSQRLPKSPRSMAEDYFNSLRKGE
jgi:hypothetical protein